MTDLDFTPTGNIFFDHMMHDTHNAIQSVKDFMLPDEMVIHAVHNACDFFNLPEAPVLHADQVCVWNGDGANLYDDILGFNRQQLMEMGIQGEDSLTLIYTHECAHRALQGFSNLDPWEHELACDYFAGIHAGLKGINIDNFEDSLSKTHGGSTHPTGNLRANFIEYGNDMAQDMRNRGIEINFENCLARFNAHLIEQDNLITQHKNECNVFESIIPAVDDAHELTFSNSEIRVFKDNVNDLERKLSYAKSEVRHRERMVDLSDTDRGHKNGDYSIAISRLSKATSKYNDIVSDLNKAKSKLNNAL